MTDLAHHAARVDCACSDAVAAAMYFEGGAFLGGALSCGYSGVDVLGAIAPDGGFLFAHQGDV